MDAVPAHQFAGLAPIHVRHVDIEQNQINALVCRHLDSGRGIRSLQDRELGMHVQLLGQGFAQIIIIVHK